MSIELKQREPTPSFPSTQPASFFEVLRLSRRELAQRIREEIERNPFFEERTNTLAQDRSDAVQQLSSIDRFAAWEDLSPEVDSDRTEEVMEAEGSGSDALDWEEPIWSDRPPHAAPAPASNEELAEELLAEAAWATQPTSLYDHLLGQLRLGPFSSDEQRIALLIFQNLDEDGYFRVDGVEGDPLIPIAAEAQVSLELAAHTLRKLQDLEPHGICARDLEECLSIQARARGEESSVVGAVIRRHLHSLQAKNLRSIATDLNVELSEVLRAERIIAEMDPRPGRIFSGEEPFAILPDVSILRSGDEVSIAVDDPLAPYRISQRYRSALRSGKARASGMEEFLRDHLFRATALIAAVQERQLLLHQIAEAILWLQRPFLERGPAALEPCSLTEVARAVGIQQALVRRIVAAKFVGTPYGVMPMAAFFQLADETTRFS